MKKLKKTPVILFLIFCLLVSITTLISFSSNTTQEVIIKNMTSVYDETSGVIVNKNNISFNDKNQVVKYNVVLENTQNYDVKISEIKLSTPTEEFLSYKVEGIKKDDVIDANSTKELIVSFETMRIDGWGNNFTDELTAKISFEKYVKQEENINPEEPNKNEATDGEADSTETENKKEEENSSGNENNREENITSKPSTDSNNKEDKVDNPYTSDKKLVGMLVIATCVAGIAVIIVSKNKLTKYIVFILLLSPAVTITNAEKVMELAIKNNVSFKSQNIMEKRAWDINFTGNQINQVETGYWQHSSQIKNIYVQNQISKIDDYEYKYDMSKEQNGRIFAYIVKNNNETCYNSENSIIQCYDLYLQADGIIYPNPNMDYYFLEMINLKTIDNLTGINTSEVISMKGVFANAGSKSLNLSLDLSNFNTGKVTNMQYMFYNTGYNSNDFILDVSSIDTSNVVDTSYMFYGTGYNSSMFTLDVSNFDTSKVTDMSYMFYGTGYKSSQFTLDIGNFDTSNVVDMSYMFYTAGYNSKVFNLDLTKIIFDNVKKLDYAFKLAGYNSLSFNTEINLTNYKLSSFEEVFYGVAGKTGTSLVIHYNSKTGPMVDKILNEGVGKFVKKGNFLGHVQASIDIGDEIVIGEEHFNVISKTDENITMLAKYNLGTNYRQNILKNYVSFSNSVGWEYTPGPKEIEIQNFDGSVKTYINEYLNYLNQVTDNKIISVDLLTINELKTLGCVMSDDYSNVSSAELRTCKNSTYKDWLTLSSAWWTRSARAGKTNIIWIVKPDLSFNFSTNTGTSGVRPVITISKETLRNLS